jgi:trimeric autotransporter adhesin
LTALHFATPFRPEVSKAKAKRPARARRRPGLRGVEALEDRQLLATFAVTNLNDNGLGSLRLAILAANAVPGPDTIDFDVAGTIQVGRASLPAITGTVTIDGTTAPGYAGTPVVTVDFRGTRGLTFNAGADGSSLKGLSLVRAGTAGVTLNASFITVQGNDIGLLPNGQVLGNRGDGVRINATSQHDLVGQANPVSSIDYFNTSGVGIQPVTGWQGIRNGAEPGQYLIVGTSNSDGLLYEGPLSGVGGTSYSVNVPGAETTSVYGPNLLANGDIQLVGSYRTGTGAVDGFLFGGSIADLSQAAAYTTVAYPGAQYTFVHSTMGGLAVGNADGPEGNAPIGTGHAFLYNISTGGLSDIVYPGATTTTAYGIWYNGPSSYTIVGGYSAPGESGDGLSHGYMVDYNRVTGQYTNWTSFDYPTGLTGQDFITHFEGISSDEKGVYTLSATSVPIGSGAAIASWVTVRRNTDGSFGPGQWVNLDVPTGGATALFTSNDSVAGNANVGIVITDSGEFSYQAQVNTSFQLSNVISGNLGNGIGIYGGSDNQVAMNDIGTDSSGSFARGNRQNGILITGGATGNLIGGEATGGNDPTGNVFVRPPQGNLISGNGANGVLITGGATGNQLSGNFVGTSASGLSALGNRLDGVAIVGASGNSLLGCTFQQDPFVFYNVLSGNGGNGLRVTNSNNTVVQANFMGVGADNDSIVANGGDGLLVSGTSANTQVGGVIPLGNVISGNNQNGIEVRDRASGFVSFNTFGGLYAFGTAAPNRRDGILITSSGGNNLIRTSIISGNLGNGIEIGGNATGVQVTETAVGTDTNIQTPLPNGGDGILITGRAHGNAIGGFQPSIEPHVTISSNAGYGIRVAGSARNNVVFNTVIGTNAQGTVPLGNRLGGIYLSPGTSSTTIGGALDVLQDKIVDNGGNGVTMNASSGNAVLNDQIRNNAGTGVYVVNGGRNDQIGSATAGNTIVGNGGDGVYVMCYVPGSTVAGNTIMDNANNGVTLDQAQRLTLGGAAAGAGNAITGNFGVGLYAFGPSTGTLVQGNTIVANTAGNVDLSKSRGITFIP